MPSPSPVLFNAQPGSVSTTLLQRLKHQDKRAWDELVVIASPLVLRWCRQCGLQHADAEDLAQDVFRRVLQGIGGFRSERPGESFRSWLRTITFNRVRDSLRAKHRLNTGDSTIQANLQQLIDGDCPVAAFDEAEERGILLRRILRFLQAEYDERAWQAFWRVTMQEEPVERVAVELGMVPNSLYVMKSRILHRLREYLGNWGEPELP
jgi:RNA polymerase sigma-70 factor (ECF subfamily)